MEVTKEATTDYGVTWALVSLDGKELGWIAKDALTTQTYAAIVSETAVEYPAVISRDTDAINTAPWGTKGYQTISTSAAYAGQTVEVTKEQTTDYGVTWAQISLNGESLGWIAKEALTAQTYAQVTKETAVAYSAMINRDSDAINTAPWGTKGYQTLATSAAYVGQTVEVTKEQETDYGVTWAQVSLNGEVLGWIAKDALKVQTYAQITEETAVDYSATISRATDAINTAPWGTKGYQTLASSADYSNQTVEVTKEQVTDYGVTWAQISLNGEVLGWIAKDALTVQTYAKIVSEADVNYSALISRGTDAINTAPWGTKGYKTISSSADYVGQSVEVTKEQVTDYGVTWAQISLNGEVLGWIAKDAITAVETTTGTITAKENVVAYQTVTEEDDTIPTGESTVVQAGAEGYDTVTYDVTYVNGIETNRVEVSRTTTAPVAEIIKVGTQVTAVKSETTSENEVGFTTVVEGDNAIPNGERVVAQAGVDGYDTVTYDVTYVNGVETNRVEISRITTAPVAEIIKVGTQVTDVRSETTSENEVGFTTVEEEDNTLPIGERVIVQAGVNGYDKVTYDVTYVNGIETNRVEVSRTTIAPVNEIAIKGTQTINDITKPVIDEASVKVSSNTATLGESVIISMAISDDNDISSVNVSLKTSFSQPNGAATFEKVELYKNNTTGLFEGILNITDSTALGTWQIASIWAYDVSGNIGQLFNTSVYDYWGEKLLLVPHAGLSYANIEVTAEVADITDPLIGAVKVSSDTVTSGESVTVSVLVNDDRGIPSSTQAAPMEWSGVDAYFISPITNNYESVSLYKNSMTGLFEGTLNITDASEVGTWRLYRITAYDTSGNRSDLYNSNAANYYDSPAVDLSSADFTVVADIKEEDIEEPVYVDVEKPQAQLILNTSPTIGPIIFTVVATDNVGVASITLPDETVVTGDIANFVVSKNGYYHVTITDVNGNIAYAGVDITNILAPVPNGTFTELSYEVSTTEPNVDAVDVTVHATDNDAVAYIIAEDGYTIINDSEYHFTVIKPGTYTIRAVDKSGNVESINIDIYNVKVIPVQSADKTAPIILFTPSRTTNAAEELVLRVTIVEDGGIATFVSHDGTTTYGWGPSEYTFYQNGTYTFKVTDNSGNEAVATYEVTQIDGFVDKVGPKITYTVSNPNPTQEQSITVYVSIPDSDFDHGVAPDGTIITSNEFSFNVAHNGYSEVVAYDKSGNVTYWSIPTFNIEEYDPMVFAMEESRTADSVTYRLIANDDVGIASITRPDGTTENMSANVDADFMEMMTFTKNGTYTLTAIDYFGKVATTTFVVDSLPE